MKLQPIEGSRDGSSRDRTHVIALWNGVPWWKSSILGLETCGFGTVKSIGGSGGATGLKLISEEL